MLRIGEMWRKTNEHKEDRMHNSPCIPGDDRYGLCGYLERGEGENQNKWWYDNGNGSYPSNCWQWIDGNGDGTAESYYFDHNGWLLTDTTTPDGYTVNASGAWVQNGVVQTKKQDRL